MASKSTDGGAAPAGETAVSRIVRPAAGVAGGGNPHCARAFG
jgi:hypothetical protein